MRGGAFLNGKEGRVGFRTNSTEYGGYIPNPYGRDLGLGYRVRTLPQGRDRWGKYSTVGRFHSSSLRFPSPANGGTEGGVKTIEEDRDERWSLP